MKKHVELSQASACQKPDGSIAVNLGLTENTEIILPKEAAEIFLKYTPFSYSGYLKRGTYNKFYKINPKNI